MALLPAPEAALMQDWMAALLSSLVEAPKSLTASKIFPGIGQLLLKKWLALESTGMLAAMLASPGGRSNTVTLLIGYGS
jgi:hypothetical protein